MCKRLYILLTCACITAGVMAATETVVPSDTTAAADTTASYHRVQLKTNLVSLGMAVPSLSLEVALAPQHSLQLDAAFNMWKYPKRTNYHLLHDYALQYRYYFDYVEHGSFIGAHIGGGAYNVAGERVPFAMMNLMDVHDWRWGFYTDSRYQGYQAFLGFHYGYKWRLSDHWRIEAVMGIGAAYLGYDGYECAECGSKKAVGHDLALGITRAQLTVGYSFGKPRPQHVVYVPDPTLPALHDTVMIASRPDTVVLASRIDTVLLPGRIDTVLITATSDTIIQMRDTERTRHIRTIDGEAKIRFVVNRTEIDTTFQGNGSQLASLARLVNRYADDPNVVMMLVTIHGTASPESPYAHNSALAQGRAQAVVDCLQHEFNLPAMCRLYSNHTAENWEGLIEYVRNDKTLSEETRQEILKIVTRTDDDPDNREWRLKLQYPEVYQHLLNDCYPELRKTEFHIEVVYRE